MVRTLSDFTGPVYHKVHLESIHDFGQQIDSKSILALALALSCGPTHLTAREKETPSPIPQARRVRDLRPLARAQTRGHPSGNRHDPAPRVCLPGVQGRLDEELLWDRARGDAAPGPV